MSRPSRHLRWGELACHDGSRTPYPDQWRSTRGKALGRLFEAIRTLAGDRPIRVNSAYRTPAHNDAVGGVPTSQHVQGRALDLAPPRGMSVMAFHTIIRALAARQRRETIDVPRIGGLARYPTFVHVDLRPSGRLVAWRGARPRADVADPI